MQQPEISIHPLIGRLRSFLMSVAGRNVESVSGGTVNTIEGNSGDKVARRSYRIGSNNIYGYGVPAY